jgi:hypothetical protein
MPGQRGQAAAGWQENSWRDAHLFVDERHPQECPREWLTLIIALQIFVKTLTGKTITLEVSSVFWCQPFL